MGSYETCACWIPCETHGAVRMLWRKLHNSLFSRHKNPDSFCASSWKSLYNLLLISCCFFRLWVSDLLRHIFRLTQLLWAIWSRALVLKRLTCSELVKGACLEAYHRHQPSWLWYGSSGVETRRPCAFWISSLGDFGSEKTWKPPWDLSRNFTGLKREAWVLSKQHSKNSCCISEHFVH